MSGIGKLVPRFLVPAGPDVVSTRSASHGTAAVAARSVVPSLAPPRRSGHRPGEPDGGIGEVSRGSSRDGPGWIPGRQSGRRRLPVRTCLRTSSPHRARFSASSRIRTTMPGIAPVFTVPVGPALTGRAGSSSRWFPRGRPRPPSPWPRRRAVVASPLIPPFMSRAASMNSNHRGSPGELTLTVAVCWPRTRDPGRVGSCHDLSPASSPHRGEVVARSSMSDAPAR